MSTRGPDPHAPGPSPQAYRGESLPDGGPAPSLTRHALFAAVMAGVLVLIAAFAVAVRHPATAPRIGQLAPELTFETFDGEQVSLSGLRGQVVVLNFWASWCKPCEQEADDLEAVWREYRDRGVVLLGINYTDTRPAALEYLARFDISYPNGPDRADRISRTYHLSGVPETLVIDQSGLLVPLPLRGGEQLEVVRLVGPIVPGSSFTPADLRALLDRLIAEAPDDA